MVNELVVNGRWDQDEMKKWLTQWEIEEIKKIPIPLHPYEDKWMWHYTKNGEFSVRSAYYVEMEDRKKNCATSSSRNDRDIWRKLWQANVPTKIRHFGWKALHQGLPMRSVLCQRGCVIDSRCPMCGENNETVFHALLSCTETQWVWRASPLRLNPLGDFKGTLLDWVIQNSRHVDDNTWWDLFWCLLWGVWLKRNAWLFENRRIEGWEVIERAAKLVFEYEAAMEKPRQIIADVGGGPKVWKAPAEGKYKINSDTALFTDGTMGLGGVVRDYLGEVMLATCTLLEGGVDVEIVEALAARHSVQIACEAGLRNLVLESDCLKLISHLNKGVQENNSFGFIVADILRLGSSCIYLSFNHVRREGNRVAHKLAHISKEYSEMRVWIEELPPEAMSIVNSDMIYMNN